jgi:excisionase family DNA binding protein
MRQLNRRAAPAEEADNANSKGMMVRGAVRRGELVPLELGPGQITLMVADEQENRIGQHRWAVEGETEVFVRELARLMERAERGELTLDEAAARLNISPMTVLRLIRNGTISARQLCRGAPWVIKAEDLERPSVNAAAAGRRQRPLPQDPHQQALTF